MAMSRDQERNTQQGNSKRTDYYHAGEPHYNTRFDHNLLTKTSAYLGAIKDLTQNELSEASEYVKQDLNEFSENYQNSVADFKRSAWYQAWDRVTWGTLAAITDKTQVEWVEIGDDIQHEGRYFVGDEVGFGQLRCVRCGYCKELFHPTKVLACSSCDGEEFVRESFEP